jgi:hypothetical protein
MSYCIASAPKGGNTAILAGLTLAFRLCIFTRDMWPRIACHEREEGPMSTQANAAANAAAGLNFLDTPRAVPQKNKLFWHSWPND